jgi:hypothetical protein
MDPCYLICTLLNVTDCCFISVIRQNTVTCHFSSACFGYEGSSARKRKVHDEVLCEFMPRCLCTYRCFSEMLLKYTCAKLHGVTSQNTVPLIIIRVNTEGFWDVVLCNWQQLLMFRRRLILPSSV